MWMEQINAFLELYGLAALFTLLLLKSIGFPIPVPNDLIMLTMAVRASEGRWVAWQAFIAGLLALVLGGIVQFLVVRACALAGLPLWTFALGSILGSGLLLSAHFFLGYTGRYLLARFGVAPIL